VRDHYLARLFEVEPMRLRQADHARYLMLSRITCAELIAATLAEWRRVGSACQGALLLWLRDLWAGAGWGVLDERGAPKSAWHPLRRVLQPQAVLLSDEGLDGLVAHLINEGRQPLQARLVVSVWDSTLLREEVVTDVHLAPRSAAAVPLLALFDHLVDLTHAHRFGPLAHRAVQARLIDDQAGERAAHWHLAPGWGAAAVHGERVDAGLTAVIEPVDPAAGRWRVVLQAQRLALFVHFEVPGFLPDDDYFHLAPGARRVVTLLTVAQDDAANPPCGWVHTLQGDHPVALSMQEAS
jgi:beta-mannosidase